MTDMLGRTLGPYTITERLGRGGMAEVYKAFHSGLSVHRAIKVIRADLATAADFRTRFQKEAQAVASLRHPNIVHVNDFGSDDGNYYMVMEFVDGQDLKKLIQTEGATRSIPRAVEIVIQLADALAYAHERHIVHRDVKPENVMLTRDGTPVLMDFGISRLLLEGTRLTQTGTGMGTPAYMAPEQAIGAESVGPPADVYALSIVLYELLTGRLPFSADTPVAVMMKAINDPLPPPRRLRGDISEALEGVILTGTQKKPQDRYPTAAQMRDVLRALAADGGLVDPDAGLAPTMVTADASRTPSKRSGVTLALAVLMFATTAGGAAWWLWGGGSTHLATQAGVAGPVLPVTTPADSEAPAVVADAGSEPEPAEPEPTRPEPTKPEPTKPEPPKAAPANPSREPAAPVVVSRPAAIVAKPQTNEETDPASAMIAITAAPEVQPPPAVAVATAPAPALALMRETPSTPDDARVQRGITTQRDLLRMFGGPDISTLDRSRRQVWVYQRAQTATESSASSRDRDKVARLGLYFGNFSLGAGGALATSSGSSQVSRQIRTLTVTVTFAADRTVADYQVESTHF